MKTPVAFLLAGACALLALAAPAAAQDLAVAISTAACKDCTCYFSSDCPEGETCGDYFTCTKVGKLDGLCKKRTAEVWSVGDLANAADAVSGYFDAFHEASRDLVGSGVSRARGELRSAQAHRLTLDGHLAVRNLTLDALDLTIGFDLVAENLRLCAVTAPVPTVRAVQSLAADDLVAAVKEGLEAAIRFNDPSLVVGPLQAFWSQHPEYEPHHTGRCYAHGHADFPYAGPLDCQVAELTNLLKLYLPSGTASTIATKPAALEPE